MALISPLKLNISKKLRKDKEFRKRFFQRQAQDETAMSIRSLREKRKMKQVDLANESKMKQSAISRIEQADYSSWTFTTLLRVANALDARLRVIFEPAEDVIAKYEEGEVRPLISEQNFPFYRAYTEVASRNYGTGVYVAGRPVDLSQSWHTETPALPTQVAIPATSDQQFN